MCSRFDDPTQHDLADERRAILAGPRDRAPLPEPEPREGWPPAAALRAETTCRACGARAYSVGPYLSDRCYGCDRHPVLCSCHPERQATLELAERAGDVVNRSLREWLDERAEEVRRGP